MLIKDIEAGKEYIKTSAYHESQIVKVLYKSDTEIYTEVTSEGCSKGLNRTFNEIECNRYIQKYNIPSPVTTNQPLH